MMLLKKTVDQALVGLKIDSLVGLVIILLARYLTDNPLFLSISLVVYLLLVIQVVRYIVHFRSHSNPHRILARLFGFLLYSLVGLSLAVYVLSERTVF